MMNYALLTDVMSLGCGAALVLRNGSTDTVIANATASGPFIPVNGNSNYYATGKDPGESLRLQASGTPSFEGAARAIVSVDQV